MSEDAEQKIEKRFFEKFMVVFALVEPLATIPQIYQVWSKGDSTGVSLVTWFFYTITAGVWLAYGIRIKDKPIIISGSFWTLTQGLVVLGILFR